MITMRERPVSQRTDSTLWPLPGARPVASVHQYGHSNSQSKSDQVSSSRSVESLCLATGLRCDVGTFDTGNIGADGNRALARPSSMTNSLYLYIMRAEWL